MIQKWQKNTTKNQGPKKEARQLLEKILNAYKIKKITIIKYQQPDKNSER